MDFNKQLKAKNEIINTYLYRYLSEVANAPDEIIEAMKYSIFAGGKRIRPVIMIAAYELFDSDIEVVMPFACALEMIHTYSLIHDDLPAMDNSDLRRGQKTNHIVFGEAMAILAGDGLLNFACETMLAAKKINSQRIVEAMSYMLSNSGIKGMIGGQVLDILNENQQIDKKLLQELHEKKTGGLIRAATVCGGICGGASAGDLALLESYATYLGLAFQIKDDILDTEGNPLILGKPVGSDSKNQKNTYVSLYGIDGAKKLLNEYTCKAKSAIESFKDKKEFLYEMTDFLINRNN